MIDQRRLDALRRSTAALEVSEELVTVELSLPAAWLLRDLIGLEGLPERAQIYGSATVIPMHDDMRRLGDALGHRPIDETKPHVSHWSKDAAKKVMSR